MNIMLKFLQYVDSDWQWKGGKISHGYGALNINGKIKYAHRISYELFNGPIPDGMYVLHSCDDPGCVNPDHLHLGNQSDNIKEAYDRNRKRPISLPGEKNPLSKLTEKEVYKIRDLIKQGKSQYKIAELYNVSQTTINQIGIRKVWKHLP